MTENNQEEKKTSQPNEGTYQVLKVQVPVRVFKLTERKAAVMFALQEHGQLYTWATDGQTDWLKRGDQSESPYCFVVVDPAYNLPEFVQLLSPAQNFELEDADTALDIYIDQSGETEK
jgi:hypothetical protein